jgi:hypothetical protein
MITVPPNSPVAAGLSGELHAVTNAVAAISRSGARMSVDCVGGR